MNTTLRNTVIATIALALLGPAVKAQDKVQAEHVGEEYPGVGADTLVARINDGNIASWAGLQGPPLGERAIAEKQPASATASARWRIAEAVLILVRTFDKPLPRGRG